MGRVRFSFAGALLLVALIAMLLVFARSDNPASATSFAPIFSGSIEHSQGEGNADINLNVAFPFPDASFDSGAFFIDGRFGVAPDAAVTDGAVAGSLTSVATLGFLNTACFIPFPVTFTLLEATTSNALLTSPFDFSTSGGVGFTGQFFGALVGTNPDNAGLAVGVTRYPDFLDLVVPQAVFGPPRERLIGLTTVGGTPVSLNLLIYNPGQLALIGFPASLGYPVLTILQNPAAPSEPNPITDGPCTPLTTSTTIQGLTTANPAAGVAGGQVKLTNPKSNDPEKPFLLGAIFTSQRDADNDGIPNNLDTCPFNINTSDDARTPVFGGDPDIDGIDASCDNRPAAFDGFDADFDGYANRADNCPQTANGIPAAPVPGPNNQLDSDGDAIGDVCDPTPGTPSGHNHTSSSFVVVVIGDHGVELKSLKGPPGGSVASGGSAVFTVKVKNESKSQTQDIEAAVRVLPAGCATVNGVLDQNSATVAGVAPKAQVAANFTVDFSACADGPFSIQADACHADDPNAGFFNVTVACPGANDGHGVDPNAVDDAPETENVDLGP